MTDKYFYYTADQINSTRVVTDDAGNVVYSATYSPFGKKIQSSQTVDDSPKPQFSNKEREQTTNLDYFGARYYDNATYRFNSTDPIINKKEAIANPQLWNLYTYCHNNPINFFDPDGNKDRPFISGKDLPVSERKGTATPILIDGMYNMFAYNCHTFAWHDGNEDFFDSRNDPLKKLFLFFWDLSPDDNMDGYRMLGKNEDNAPEDRVIYYADLNNNGKYNKGDYIAHSAIVKSVDSMGYTITVLSKMGERGLSLNHPRAPKYYEKTKFPPDDQNAPEYKLNRAYFRKK